jgi:hypothetical protein
MPPFASKPPSTLASLNLPLELWRKRRISVPQSAELKGISEDTFRRHYPHLIKKVSPRRDTCELGAVLDA